MKLAHSPSGFAKGNAAASQPLRILLVEDNTNDAYLLHEMFSEEPADSYVIKHVPRLGLALDYLSQRASDIVLLDLGLPDGEGVHTVQRVHELAPDVPLIVLTGLDDDDVVREAMHQGAQDYLVKGQVENRALPRALRHAIDRFGMVREAALTNAELARRIEEKDVLLGEIHHRVKNNLQLVLSLLGMEVARIQDATTVAMLQTTQNRIRSMAAVHQTLYESKDFARVDFEAFLRSFLPSLIEVYSLRPDQIALDIKVTQRALRIDAAIPCGLIVNELVSNALKHAFPNGREGRISVQFLPDEGEWATLLICDDGVGLPDGFSFQSKNTLGTQLVYLLSRQMGGTVTAHCDGQTCFRVQVPLMP